MLLKGSCHCGKVQFIVKSYAPVPYMRCYCSICRKTAGTGGYAINLGAWFDTLKVKGKKYIAKYRAKIREDGSLRHSKAQRHFCSYCGTALWIWDPEWPELVHPHAGAIDTKLPKPSSSDHIMLDSKADWVVPCIRKRDRRFKRYAKESLEDWHKRHKKLST